MYKPVGRSPVRSARDCDCERHWPQRKKSREVSIALPLSLARPSVATLHNWRLHVCYYERPYVGGIMVRRRLRLGLVRRVAPVQRVSLSHWTGEQTAVVVFLVD